MFRLKPNIASLEPNKGRVPFLEMWYQCQGGTTWTGHQFIAGLT